MARLPNFLVIIRSEKLSGKGQGRGAKKRTFRFGKKNVSFPKVETFRFADYIYLFYNKTGLFEIRVNNKTTFFEKKQINVFLYKEQEEVIVVFQILSEFLVGYFL